MQFSTILVASISMLVVSVAGLPTASPGKVLAPRAAVGYEFLPDSGVRDVKSLINQYHNEQLQLQQPG
ncbi:MAG: hypothetical protein M1826_004869 [Phylliscum demangeonii]|nr:MAG: hypothetical protein M1826_004869 [Phylliscum demangeonii]